MPRSGMYWTVRHYLVLVVEVGKDKDLVTLTMMESFWAGDWVRASPKGQGVRAVHAWLW